MNETMECPEFCYYNGSLMSVTERRRIKRMKKDAERVFDAIMETPPEEKIECIAILPGDKDKPSRVIVNYGHEGEREV